MGGRKQTVEWQTFPENEKGEWEVQRGEAAPCGSSKTEAIVSEVKRK